MLLYKYIAKKFWVPFGFAVGVFTALVVVGDVFEKMKNLNNGTTTVLDLVAYAAATFPNWLTTIMPVACLLGGISVISEMVSNGEWTACVAGGFSPKQLFKPIVACILCVVFATMLVQEFIVPSLNAKANTIYYTRIKPAENFNPRAKSNVQIKVSPNQFLSAKLVDLSEGTMNQVSLDTYNDALNIAEQIVAEKMQWDKENKNWAFAEGIKRTFLNKLDTTEEHFKSETSPLTTGPEDIYLEKSDDDDKLRSIRALSTKIKFYKQSGLAHYTAETARQTKLATPFVTVIMCLLGMPFAISVRRKSKIMNIIASMVIAFTFWWLMSVAASVGENGYVNPFVAGWGPVVLFGAVVFFEFKWMRL